VRRFETDDAAFFADIDTMGDLARARGAMDAAEA
jgi:hypothetical protein